ncbi:DUF2892 domain-containing protein [Xanthobacteraceae bacterium Astr-EGSB]|uniref:YgaP family membrane protein n=1 Tax=Astrobacterium formosum TaxID=3069710 RepID=UPI0027B1344B|nr:DUF2892 domain-containing protein [Xanthobacteraceae bacterium Astr-EGSB]
MSTTSLSNTSLYKTSLSESALPKTTERVRRNTDAEINARIERQIDRNLLYFADHLEEIPQRLSELDAEWDVERALEANAATATVIGVLLARSRGARFLLLPAAVGAFLLQHAIQGWCPPLPVLRRLGFRTAREIERERHGLKALRGDYDVLQSAEGVADRAGAALAAASAS